VCGKLPTDSKDKRKESVSMVRPDFAKWGQSPEAMRRLSVEATHQRSRERFQSLYIIGSGQQSATQWAQEIDRQPRTVLGWIHQYNEQGSDSLVYQASGGRTPFLAKQSKRASLPRSRPVNRLSMSYPDMAGR
jgi:hypothetical protein